MLTTMLSAGSRHPSHGRARELGRKDAPLERLTAPPAAATLAGELFPTRKALAPPFALAAVPTTADKGTARPSSSTSPCWTRMIGVAPEALPTVGHGRIIALTRKM